MFRFCGQSHGQHCPRYAQRKVRFCGARTKPSNLTCVVHSWAPSNYGHRARSFRSRRDGVETTLSSGEFHLRSASMILKVRPNFIMFASFMSLSPYRVPSFPGLQKCGAPAGVKAGFCRIPPRPFYSIYPMARPEGVYLAWRVWRAQATHCHL